MTRDQFLAIYLGDYENIPTEELCRLHEALNREADRVALEIPRSRERAQV